MIPSLGFISPPLLNNGHPVITAVTVAERVVAEQVLLLSYRFFREETDITKDVARASGISLKNSSSVELLDHSSVLRTYARSTFGNELGFDLRLARATHCPRVWEAGSLSLN